MVLHLKRHKEMVFERLNFSKPAVVKVKEPFTCLHCGEDLSQLTAHFQKKHFETFHYNFTNKCPICKDFEYNTYQELRDHNDDVHGGKFVFRCNKCPEYFSGMATIAIFSVTYYSCISIDHEEFK